jgi:hypothetical protein
MTLKKFHGGGFRDGWRVIFYAVGTGLCRVINTFFHNITDECIITQK